MKSPAGLLKFLLNVFFSPVASPSNDFFGRSLPPSNFLGPADAERGREEDDDLDDLSGPPVELLRLELLDLSSRLFPDFLNAIFNV